MKRFVFALTVLALSTLSFAGDSAEQTNAQQASNAALQSKIVAANSPQPSTNCQFVFSSGAQSTFLKYCVTDTGNILGLESPQGHLMVPDNREGYGICDQSTGVAYNDFGSFGDSGNWGSANVVSHSGKTVKIARTTSDGIWTLTQTFTQVAGNEPMAKATMTLKNNTAVARGAFLLRYADTDIDSDESNNLDGTVESASAWNSVSTPNENSTAHGLMLQNVGVARATHQALAQPFPSPPDTCNPFGGAPSGPLIQIDGSLALIYQAFIGGGATTTATVGYRGF